MFKFSGFTLPEIIITIAISAILVSLAHPYFIEILISNEVEQIKKTLTIYIQKAKYDAQVSPYYAASRLWTDAIIDPLDTRTWISMGIEAANHAPIEKKFNLGVIQV